MSESRRRYESLQKGEWGVLLEKPKALDRDSPETLETADLVARLGFEHFILIIRLVLPTAGPVQVALSNWRPDWYERYWAKDYMGVDPVIARMLVAHRPFDWNEVLPHTPTQKLFFADAARHGMVDGFAGAVRIGSDQVGFFSVSSGRPCTAEAKSQAMSRIFHHTALIYDRIQDQMLTDDAAEPIVLTARQREALQLTLRGVSRRDASRQMRCSESNFVRHQEAARRKLGEATNHGAVRKALAMNLIRPYDKVAEDAAMT